MVRVPPKLMAGARRGARSFGKSDSIDALAIARAALGHPDLPVAVEDHEAREIKLCLGDPRSPPTLRSFCRAFPPGALDRKVWLDRVERRSPSSGAERRGPDRAGSRVRCPALPSIHELERESRSASLTGRLLDLKGCGALIAGKLIGEPAGSADSAPTRSSRVSPASPRSTPPRVSNNATASTATEIASSTPRCTSWPWSKAAGTRAPARISNAGRPRARPDSKRCAASSDCWPASSSAFCGKHPQVSRARRSRSAAAGFAWLPSPEL